MNKNIYVLYGEESYLIDREIKKIVTSILGEDIENKIVKYDMLEDNIKNAIDDLTSMSLFSDKKIIICKNCLFLTGSTNSEINHDIDALMSLINSEIDNSLMLIVPNEKLDERKKIVKELKKKVNINSFNKLKENELITFIENEFKQEKYKVDFKTVKLFLDTVGNNLGIIISEIEKLKLYKLNEKIICEQDVLDISSRTLNDNIFDLVDAVIKRDVERTLLIYDDLLVLNEEAIKLVVVIANQFRLIYQTKTMYKSGYSELDISKHLEVHPYRIKLANEIRIDEQSLLNFISKLANLDIGIKTGTVNKDVAFEMFLLEI